MTAPCPRCDHVHGSDWAVAVHRFAPGGPAGYRAAGVPGAPLRPTRAQAIADQCAHYAAEGAVVVMAARHDPATCTTCRLLGGPAWCPNRIAAARHPRWCRYCHGAGEHISEYSPDVGDIWEMCPDLEAEAEHVAATDPRVTAAMAAAVDRWRNSPPPPAVACPWCATGDCDETHQEVTP